VASFWDVADYRASLSKIESVRIEYDPPDRAPGEIAPKALLAVGWLATCLGWEVEGSDSTVGDEGERRFTLRSGERTLEVSLHATEDAAGRDGMITSLTLRAEGGDEFSVALRPEEAKLETRARVGGASHEVTRVLGFESRTEGQRLSTELEILARDVVYERSVAFAARLLETLKD
jgi:glucose-6-phosphate dehydrogenase assembly protein OpcA